MRAMWRRSLVVQGLRHGPSGSDRRGGFTLGRLASALLGQRSSASPAVARYLALHGADRIVSIAVRRQPMNATYEGIAQFLTLGQWGLAKQASGLERIYHVSLVLRLLPHRDDGRDHPLHTIVIEKRPIVQIVERDQPPDGGDRMAVALPRRDLSLLEFVGRASDRYGARFWDYDPRVANCQDLIIFLLSTWGVLTPRLVRFIKQPMDVLMRPALTRAVTSLTTDAAARADILVNGGCKALPCF